MDQKINLTSSYLDLSTLYGFNDENQKKMRTYSDGLIKPDCFYDARLLGFPPAVSGLMIGLNRFHNSVARDLAAINEGGRFSFPSLEPITAMIRKAHPEFTAEEIAAAAKDAAVAKRDNDLFQTARLYNPCVTFLI
jgi:Animal haem peroxidase